MSNLSGAALAPARSLSRILATVLLPFALAHFISYLYRSVNAVVYPDLVQDLGLTANTLGLLTGVYFIAFAAAQLPIGVALDRFGPRKVQLPMLLIATVGGLVFAFAQSLTGLLIGRALIGLGVAASLMSAIKAASLWLPPSRLPLVTSILLAFGGLGAVVSTAPMQLALQYISWREAFGVLSLATLAIVTLIFTSVPEHAHKSEVRVDEALRSVGQLFRTGSFWRLVLYTLFSNAAYMSIQGLWIGPWLRDVGHLSRGDMADVLLLGTIAMVVGSLFFGWFTDRMRQHSVRPISICGGGMLVFLIFQALMVQGHVAPPWLVAAGFSFFGTASAMNYAIVAQSMPPHLTGRVSTSFNLLIFVVAFAMQWGMGALINTWPAVDGQYPEVAYRVTLACCLGLQIPGLLIWLSFKPWKK